jgi:hypothetical protein
VARAAIAGCTQTHIRSTLMRSIKYASLLHTLLLPFPGFPLGSLHANPPQLEWSLLAPCLTHVSVDHQHALCVGVLVCRMCCPQHAAHTLDPSLAFLTPFSPPAVPHGATSRLASPITWSTALSRLTHIPDDDQHALYVGVLECRMR